MIDDNLFSKSNKSDKSKKSSFEDNELNRKIAELNGESKNSDNIDDASKII